MTVDVTDPASMARFAREQKRAVVATVSAGGMPEAALVGIAALDDGTLIFDCHESFRKVANLRSSPRVALVIGVHGDVTVQVEGEARIADSAAERERWGGAYVAQFLGSRALDEEFVVVSVRPAWVRVYDARTDPPRVAEAVWSR